MSAHVLGVVIAGGSSTRFGSPKALAPLAGVRVVDRVAAALREAVDGDVVAIVNDPVLAGAIRLPHRADVRPGSGPLGGLHAALLWARERGCRGILAAGCDMPFLAPALLHELVGRSHLVDAVLPASEGRRGMEPLCAWYGTGCLPAIERALDRGDARMIAFHADAAIAVMPIEEVRRFGDPAVLFRNLNTPADAADAERRLADGAT